MRCPACNAENLVEAVSCAACGGPLAQGSSLSNPGPRNPPARRPAARKRDPGSEAKANATETGNNRAARRAYRLSLYSLVPGLGLILGPTALLLAGLALRNPPDEVGARNRAQAAVLLSALVTLTQWIGVLLMIWGWRF